MSYETHDWLARLRRAVRTTHPQDARWIELLQWSTSVERRMPQPVECPPTKPIDANTAALVREAVDLQLLQDGMALVIDNATGFSITIAVDSLREALQVATPDNHMPADEGSAAPQRSTYDPQRLCSCESGRFCPVKIAPPSSGKCNCGGTCQFNGPGKACDKCGQYVRNKPQSPWVPEDAEEHLGAQEFRDKGKPPEQTVSERIIELEADVERLKAESANWRERAKTAEAECERRSLPTCSALLD